MVLCCVYGMFFVLGVGALLGEQDGEGQRSGHEIQVERKRDPSETQSEMKAFLQWVKGESWRGEMVKEGKGREERREKRGERER